MATHSPDPLSLRPRDAAKALGISARTLWGLSAPRGPIPCLRIGHGKRQTVLYPVADLQAWLSQQAGDDAQRQSAAPEKRSRYSCNSDGAPDGEGSGNIGSAEGGQQ